MTEHNENAFLNFFKALNLSSADLTSFNDLLTGKTFTELLQKLYDYFILKNF